MVSIVPVQRRTEASPAAAASAAAARTIFSLERRRREDEGRGGMDLSGTQGEFSIPMRTAASPYGGGGGAGGNVLQLHHEHGNNNGYESPALPSSQPAATTEEGSSGMKRAAAAGTGAAGGGGGGSAVKYRECLKNHAAAMGGNATDGCGEFMPSGDEGSLESLKCSACGCHRNFHRKEVDDDVDVDGCAGHGYSYGHRLIAPAMPHHKNGGGGLLVTADPYGAYAAMRAAPPLPPPGHPLHHQFVNAVPLSVMHASESDEMDGVVGRGSGSSSSKKRFRTKFTAEQKARMLDFAERVGWRLQRLDDAMVHAFCQEIGVRRRVLKVWMHNNKHNLATKRLEAPPEVPMPEMASPPPPQIPMPMVQRPAPSSSQPVPSFRHGGPTSPPPQMPVQMVPPPPQFHRGPGSPLPLKLD